MKQLLKYENVNVNCRDESGWTLISLSIVNQSDEIEELLELLIKEKGADPDIPDENGLTPLHYLVKIDIDTIFK